ncbi:unnamed protein product, partial [Prunus brigantina]
MYSHQYSTKQNYSVASIPPYPSCRRIFLLSPPNSNPPPCQRPRPSHFPHPHLKTLIPYAKTHHPTPILSHSLSLSLSLTKNNPYPQPTPSDISQDLPPDYTTPCRFSLQIFIF